ncbi:cation:proton antiporter, partial [Nocardioides sp.]|uniref:cation:proton antiporter n=1 Tax=Nocardioides sp. TaxID=35761 RepID=UPI002B27441F
MTEVLLIAAAIFGFALFSRGADRSMITAPMVFTAVGLAVGGEGLGLFDLDLEGEAASILVEATLVLVLFTDAARIDLTKLRDDAWLPGRLLGVGLPLMLVLGTLAALLVFPGLSWPEAALLAAVVAPTDAALGQAVVSDRRLPVRLRQGLNVESGLNDGVMVPVITVLLALAAVEAGGPDSWTGFVASQLGFGLGVGLVCGLGAGWLLERRSAGGAVDGVFRQLGALSIAAGAYAGAELLGGNGFVAAFVAGLVFGRVAQVSCNDIVDFTEDEGQLLTAATFFIFGALFAGSALTSLSWSALAYAALSLVVVRTLAVLLALLRSGALIRTRLFIGWFGPRGLASLGC